MRIKDDLSPLQRQICAAYEFGIANGENVNDPETLTRCIRFIVPDATIEEMVEAIRLYSGIMRDKGEALEAWFEKRNGSNVVSFPREDDQSQNTDHKGAP
jgi:hypothetical protein